LKTQLPVVSKGGISRYNARQTHHKGSLNPGVSKFNENGAWGEHTIAGPLNPSRWQVG